MHDDDFEMGTPIDVGEYENGRFWIVTLNTPPGNIIDTTMIDELTAVAERAAAAPNLRALIFTGSDGNFSYGASIQEHLPDQVASLLQKFHTLIRKLFAAGRFTIAAVHGQCLGGGLELATFCNRINAAPDARLGQPEIRLGVWAPIASVLLPERIQRAWAEELCLTGRILSAKEAYEVGLVDEVDEMPLDAAVAFYEHCLAQHSASSLQHAVRAIRRPLEQHFDRAISELERSYLDDLMATHDAKEGLAAFLEKREPRWKDG